MKTTSRSEFGCPSEKHNMILLQTLMGRLFWIKKFINVLLDVPPIRSLMSLLDDSNGELAQVKELWFHESSKQKSKSIIKR